MFDGIGFLEQGTLQLIYTATKCWLEQNTGNPEGPDHWVQSCFHANMVDLKDQVEAEYNIRERREEAKRYQAFMIEKEAQKGTV
jgi:hypothetical protein